MKLARRAWRSRWVAKRLWKGGVGPGTEEGTHKGHLYGSGIASGSDEGAREG